MIDAFPKITITESSISKFFETIADSIRIHGLPKIADRFNQIAMEEKDIMLKEILQCIMEKVSDHYSVSVEEIISNSKKPNAVIAKRVSYLLVLNNTSISAYRTAKCFGHDEKQVRRAKKEIEIMREMIAQQKADSRMKKFVEDYETLNETVMTEKKKIEKKHSKK